MLSNKNLVASNSFNDNNSGVLSKLSITLAIVIILFVIIIIVYCLYKRNKNRSDYFYDGAGMEDESARPVYIR